MADDNKNTPPAEGEVKADAPAAAPANGGAPTSEPAGGDVVQISRADLAKILEGQAQSEKDKADMEARMAGLEAMVEASKSPDALGMVREKKSFEPKFRTVRLRKFPIAGDVNNLGIVVGWTDRGAYQEVDRSGVSPQTVDMLDVVFLGHERNEAGQLQAEQIRLLDFLNAPTIVCKVLDMHKEARVEPTGEEIHVTTWDPQHGLVDTGETIDGYVAYSDITYKLAVPGFPDAVEIDGTFVN